MLGPIRKRILALLGGSVLALACGARAQTSSFWSDAAVPAAVTGNDPSPVELGLKFSSSVAGTVTAIRFYKATNTAGTHTGTLWTSSGVKLASVTFTNETASGWQTQALDWPVAIAAGATYVVSYHTVEYAYSYPFFSQSLSAGPLTAPVNAGVYAYGTGTVFPASSWNASNYWVDVVFASAAAAAPVITSQPASQTVAAGQTATFTVGATGTAPLSYQWRKNGANISGANASSYTTPAASSSDNGAQFSVVVSNAAGSATSGSATLAVSTVSSCAQTSWTRWSNSPLAPQTGDFTASYDATPSLAAMDGVVGFSLNSAKDYTSLAAITRFSPAGVIDVRNGGDYAADTRVEYAAGSTYHFRVVIRLSTKSYSVYVTAPGQAETAIAANYAFRSEQASASSLNNWAMATLSGAMSVCNMAIAPLSTAAAAPVITSQPASQTVAAGQTATFTVGATGTAPLSYQWRKNGANISGANASSYTTPAASSSDSGAQFSVVVSNAAGSATSGNATLAVGTATKLLAPSPASLSFGNVNLGTGAALSATVTNTGNASVTISGVSVSGAGFSVSGIWTGQIIAAGQSATLAVQFAPASAGSVSGSVKIASDASNSPATIALSGAGVQLMTHTTSLTWTASSSAVIGYNVYSSNVAGGPYAKLTPLPVAGITYRDATVQAGKTYYYVVTAVNASSAESAYSNQAAAVIP